ncbi:MULTISPECIES: HP1 family phage holin [unclassified Pantoea]|uniref:HP1 family phage holin n=1 Tax=unclassified Pantoea TaxID=2630326 RepID=UPI001C94E177|nr:MULTISPECIES: HP1 family phage holin [unclassified Pantoea]MBY4840984.1 phage holin family protein [Pantoea sp. DY-5]MDR6348520.1 flagellar motor component MotA [Pantoea sp. SORGH_AS_0659]
MGLTMDRVVSFLSYLPSAFLTSLGLLSLTQWATLIGVVLGILTYLLNRRHKQRIEEEEKKRTAIFKEMAERATQHDLPDVVCAIEEIARLDKRRKTA